MNAEQVMNVAPFFFVGLGIVLAVAMTIYARIQKRKENDAVVPIRGKRSH